MTRHELMDKAINRGTIMLILLQILLALGFGGTIIFSFIPIGWQIILVTVSAITSFFAAVFFVGAITTFFRACDCEEDDES